MARSGVFPIIGAARQNADRRQRRSRQFRTSEAPRSPSYGGIADRRKASARSSWQWRRRRRVRACQREQDLFQEEGSMDGSRRSSGVVQGVWRRRLSRPPSGRAGECGEAPGVGPRSRAPGDVRPSRTPPGRRLLPARTRCRARAAAATPTPLPNAATSARGSRRGRRDAYCRVQGLAGRGQPAANGAVLPAQGPWFLSNGATNFSGTLSTTWSTAAELYRPISRDEHFDALPTIRSLLLDSNRFRRRLDRVDCSGWADDTPGQLVGTVGPAKAQ